MFSNLSNLVQKAQQLVDVNILPQHLSSDRKPSKASLFRLQFGLPEGQNPLQEITAELILPGPKAGSASALSAPKPQRNTWDKGTWDNNREITYVGRLHVSERYLCFSTIDATFSQNASTSASSTFNGATHGTGAAAYGFTLPLCAVRRVERLNSQSHTFALSISTWNGYPSPSDPNPKATTVPGGKTAVESPKLKLQLAGSRAQCERFCDGLKKGLRDGMRQVDNMRKVVSDCYSEYMLAAEEQRRQHKSGTDGAQSVNPDLLGDEPTKDADTLHIPDSGLGTIFKYPGDARKLRDKGKMRLWYEYLRQNGRNATLVRQPDLARLIRIGLPNRLRGEIWELSSGAFFLRLQDPQQYQNTLAKYSDQASLAIDEIEKDLNRSLPEYAGFQSEEGIVRLRRVLTAYSWTNLEVGYCQAMNIVVAAMLIYLSETQAFYVLSVLCDRLLPGYYSTTMYGTLLDQRVFESLVEKTLPILSDHLIKTDVQLSVVSLPWFLSLYINSIPLTFAFRVLDVFFLEGPKVLFQVGLAILRINGEELLDAADDGTFISVLKGYFARLGESAHPKSENPKLRAVTNFQALMVVAFREFAGITQSLISEQRTRHKDAVLQNIESFAKRTSIRNLGAECKKLSPNDLGFLYDRFYGVLYDRQQRQQVIEQASERRAKASKSKTVQSTSISVQNNDPEVGRVGLGPSPTQMDYDAFREFLAGISKWAITDSPSSPAKETSNGKQQTSYFSALNRQRSASTSPWGHGPEPADHDLMRRLYKSWQSQDTQELDLQHMAAGLAGLKGSQDIMSNIAYFFDLYDDDKDGKVDREGILRISEGLLFLSRRGLVSNQGMDESLTSIDGLSEKPVRKENRDEQFLSAVSAFIRRCFEYADPAQSPSTPTAETPITDEIDNDKQDEDRPTMTRKGSSNKNATANVALDPDNPLHLTLPTFRMLVLADEALESFFDSGLPNSFHLADAPLSSTSLTTTSTGLTTFASSSSTSSPAKSSMTTAGPAAGVVAPGKGLRGMLDNIVTDGMRVAADVKRRMDETQNNSDRSSISKHTEDDEDEDEDEREGDQDLLMGLDAAAPEPATASVEKNNLLTPEVGSSLLDASPSSANPASAGQEAAESDEVSGTVFER